MPYFGNMFGGTVILECAEPSLYGSNIGEQSMPATNFDDERMYNNDQFTTRAVFVSDRMKVVLGYFDSGQFIPVHAPNSDVTIAVQSGTGVVREGTDEYAVKQGDVVVVEAGVDRGVKADNMQLEALLVTAPPPSDAEHESVREGIRCDEFIP
jgi:quercetin dioxygenase-like cupin family protein